MNVEKNNTLLTTIKLEIELNDSQEEIRKNTDKDIKIVSKKLSLNLTISSSDNEIGIEVVEDNLVYEFFINDYSNNNFYKHQLLSNTLYLLSNIFISNSWSNNCLSIRIVFSL